MQKRIQDLRQIIIEAENTREKLKLRITKIFVVLSLIVRVACMSFALFSTIFGTILVCVVVGPESIGRS
jgi:hypothetical protein